MLIDDDEVTRELSDQRDRREIAAGALHAEGHWVRSRRGFLFPVQALSRVFRGKFLSALKRALGAGRLRFAGSTAALADAPPQQRLFAALCAQHWVVYAKRPFAGPEQVLDYLGRYTHRVALTNNRLLTAKTTKCASATRTTPAAAADA